MIRMIRTKTLRALKEGAELASVLETDLETSEATTESLRTELVAAEARNTDLHRLVELLVGATKYAFDAADAPIDVVLHEGKVRSAHRDRASAQAATPHPDATWKPTPDPDPDPLGWKIYQTTPPPLAAPPTAGEIDALLERLERPALEQIETAKRLQELPGELETIRSQRDTAIKDTETALAALTAESLAFAFHREAVTEAVTEIAFALLSSDTAASVREVSGLLLRHAELFGIDPHGPATDAGTGTETKGAVA
ncbi:hypothetical protein SAMN04490357_7683 [Streptomyces misionensis]|uniref:Uncharacterized protein n=1 Tax=Streptomyces misionensis TaxID=67331 RepID=A0A1H5K592_9ACTN|nr:hypothetical protein [Streptomyces misionensis]SEE59161.1 hypothetical protein SAMN04490357_7683 [Streptomyces misionensis]